MVLEYSYDLTFDPPAPIAQIAVGLPGRGGTERLIAFLDSGADMTALPAEAIQRLGLRRVGVVQVEGFRSSRAEQEVFGAAVVLDNRQAWTVEVVSWDGPYVILGRDVLNRWRVTLEGPAQRTRIDTSQG